MNNAIDDVLAERERQKAVEGWTAEHDDEHTDNSLATAAACYALTYGTFDLEARYDDGNSVGWWVPVLWPRSWHPSWYKSAQSDDPVHRRRNLVKAGALVIAEIERIDRAAQRCEHGVWNADHCWQCHPSTSPETLPGS